MKMMCDLYINRAGIVGVFHCAVPAIIWFLYVLITVPFRDVYLLRLGLCIIIGCPIGAYLNRYSVDMWLAKHRGDSGPARIIDGTLNGAAVGVGTALLPALTALISTNHPEMAKTFIIVVYVASALLGGIIGTMFAAIGRKYVSTASYRGCVTIRHPGQACSPAESSFQPESLNQGASRDPEVYEMILFPWIPLRLRSGW